MRVLVIRPEPAASKTAEKLHALGHEPILFPMSEYQCSTGFGPSNLHAATGLIFTSSIALRCLKGRIEDNKTIFDKPVYTVGDKTADLARNMGFTKVLSANGNGGKLAQFICAELAETKENSNLAYLTRPDRTADLEEILRSEDIAFKTHIVYEMTSAFDRQEFDEIISDGKIDTVLFYSKSAAKIFFDAIGDIEHNNITSMNYACLSKEISQVIPKQLSDRITLAIEPNEHHLLKCITD